MSFRFFGREITREAPSTATPHVGASMETMIDDAMASAAVTQRALAQARNEAAKRQREEDRHIARMLAVNPQPGENK